MSLAFPKFDVEFLEFLFACGRINDPSPELRAWAEGLKDGDHVESVYETNGARKWIILIANLHKSHDEDRPNDYLHFHSSAARDSFFDGDRDDDEPPNSLDDIQEFFRHVSGRTLDFVRVGGQFKIPSKAMPKHSVAELILGTEATVGGESFALKRFEGRFTNPDIPWTTLEFLQKKDICVAKLNARHRNVALIDSYLIDFERELEDGLRKLILEDDGS